VLLLLGGGGFAGWKYWWLPNHPTPAASQAVVPDSTRRAGTSVPATASAAAAPASTQQPPATGHQPPATAVDSPLVALDKNADSVTAAVRGYDALVQAGRTGCDGLAQSLEAMENSWMRYNIGKKKVPTLSKDQDRFTRDNQLYMAVDSVERDFDRSGCTRP